MYRAVPYHDADGCHTGMRMIAKVRALIESKPKEGETP